MSYTVNLFSQDLHKPANLLKVTLLHGGFSRFLNCKNGTILHNVSHIKFEAIDYLLFTFTIVQKVQWCYNLKFSCALLKGFIVWLTCLLTFFARYFKWNIVWGSQLIPIFFYRLNYIGSQVTIHILFHALQSTRMK